MYKDRILIGLNIAKGKITSVGGLFLCYPRILPLLTHSAEI